MIIDVVTDKGIQYMRYESDCSPKIGETISIIFPEQVQFRVTAVDHLIKPKLGSDEMRQELITIQVKEEN